MAWHAHGHVNLFSVHAGKRTGNEVPESTTTHYMQSRPWGQPRTYRLSRSPELFSRGTSDFDRELISTVGPGNNAWVENGSNH